MKTEMKLANKCNAYNCTNKRALYVFAFVFSTSKLFVSPSLWVEFQDKQNSLSHSFRSHGLLNCHIFCFLLLIIIFQIIWIHEFNNIFDRIKSSFFKYLRLRLNCLLNHLLLLYLVNAWLLLIAVSTLEL
jgi:hypothetical protein